MTAPISQDIQACKAPLPRLATPPQTPGGEPRRWAALTPASPKMPGSPKTGLEPAAIAHHAAFNLSPQAVKEAGAQALLRHMGAPALPQTPQTSRAINTPWPGAHPQALAQAETQQSQAPQAP